MEKTFEIGWKATYENGECLEQMSSDITLTYNNIDRRQLVTFQLFLPVFSIGVNLKNGRAYINEAEINIKKFSNNPVKYKLIYFMDLIQQMGSNRIDKKYTLGLQANIDGNNKKILLICNGSKLIMLRKD